MKKVWITVNKCNVKCETKNKIFIGLLIVLNALIGGLLWLSLGRWVLPELLWMICFMGYPAVFIGAFGGILYLYNHEFS